MSSINPVSPGVGDLLQTFLGNRSSPVSGVLSSTAVQSALDVASPGDLVQLSSQAVQSLQAAGLFGNSDGEEDQAATTDFGSLALQALGQPASGSASGAGFAQQEAAVLFAGSLGTEAANSTFSVLG